MRFDKWGATLALGFLLAHMGLAQSAGPRQTVENAAGALGGLDRVQKVKNIRLIGYGQYGYMFGGGNITGDPNAPMKFEAANTLQRVYDLEHGRYQQTERRNYLFPFAISGGHDYHLNDNRLDGDIPYDVLPSGEARRRIWPVHITFQQAGEARLFQVRGLVRTRVVPLNRCRAAFPRWAWRVSVMAMRRSNNAASMRV